MVKNNDGRLQLFARGSDDALWTTAQTTAGGSFGAWTSLGGILSSAPSAGIDAAGRLDVYALHGTTTYHLTQTAPGQGFGKWASLGGTLNGF